ncbi:FAD-dependent oxidoreductase [Nocardioides antri]|uniref:FAD-dependent oxidoreductase n=1 Tax=Nocardioides antri TaxID=2607659 RepID=A0A5B1M122_9ACTN|nr:FAD-dependent oxidoreductase [Nocardioides antri]KAA1426451.1 FAD-dependent oxidoreductase [Nocardioides antri]
MEHRSVWLATAEVPTYDPLLHDLDVDVVVVGGGLVGLTTAVLAQRDGPRVAVLEGARIGCGTTGHTTGKVTSQHSLIYADLVRRHGEHDARRYAEANQAGVEKLAGLADELGIECELARAVAFAYTTDPRQCERIEDEVAAAKELGLPASLSSEIDLPFEVEAAVRFDDQVHFHPGKYLAGLARALVRGGGAIYENTRVSEIEESPDHRVHLTTDKGTVGADQAVVASLIPPGLVGGYFAKTRPHRSYGLAMRLNGEAPRSMAISVDAPTRSTRPWGQDGIIIVGNGHEVGDDEDTEARYRDLEDWGRSTFDVKSTDYRWSAQDYATPDQVPYVGRSALGHRVLVATGFRKWGLSNGTAAAIMLADLLADRENDWLRVFDASRIGDALAVGRLVKDNLKVGTELFGGRLNRPGPVPIDHLQPEEGGIVELDRETVGGYRDAEGALHAVKLRCSHLGCPLHWNNAEHSWDCRCHGSRFDVDGAVLNGPATGPLETRL